MIRQRHWRMAGGIGLAVCALMAWFGVEWAALRQSPVTFLSYWGLFLLIFVFVLLCVVIDLRFIRMEYAIAKRALFEQTLGKEKIRNHMNEASNSQGADRANDKSHRLN